jgi:hypothetical protein
MSAKKKAKKATAKRTPAAKAKKTPAAKARTAPAGKVKKTAKAKSGAAPKKRAKVTATKKQGAKKQSAAKKPAAARKGAVSKAKAPKKTASPKAGTRDRVRRRDGTGHLDPKYASELRSRSLEDSAEREDKRAFLGGPRSADDRAEELGEEFVETVTSGEDEGEDVLDQHVPEEDGGPFIVTSAATEFANGTDASNPEDATREPFPKV